MILLESANRIIADTLTQRYNGGENEAVELTIADFDNVGLHLTTSDPSGSSAPQQQQRETLWISISMKCFDELVKYGAKEYLENIYKGLIAPTPEKNYNLTLKVQNSDAPSDAKAKEEWIKSISMLKRNCMAAPYERAFNEVSTGNEATELMAIHYRDEEAIYIKAQPDRVTVIVSTTFKEETDKIIAKVFLQEFVDARKQPSIQNAPQVLFTNREPPAELKGVKGLKDSDQIGYVTFVLFPRHFTAGHIREETISLFQNFRDYLHYHIKCSKAYMHSRMRARVADWTKVLNRAKPEAVITERKLASGRTFVRKV